MAAAAADGPDESAEPKKKRAKKGEAKAKAHARKLAAAALQAPEAAAANAPAEGSAGEAPVEMTEKVADGDGPEKVSRPNKAVKMREWPETRKALCNAGVDIPQGFDGSKASFTMNQTGKSSIGCLWADSQLYVSKVVSREDAALLGVNVNRRSGATISVKKRGGWSASFQLALRLAGWKD